MNNPGFWNSLSPARKEIVRQVFFDIGQPISSLPEDELDIYHKVAERYRAEVIEPAERLRQEMQERSTAVPPLKDFVSTMSEVYALSGVQRSFWDRLVGEIDAALSLRNEDAKAERLLIADLLDAMDAIFRWANQIEDDGSRLPLHVREQAVKASNAANTYWYPKQQPGES